MKSRNLVVVERMNNLGLWEFFRFSDEETDDVVCKMALHHDEPKGHVEYGVWRKGDAEPSATGTLGMDGREWDDDTREKTLETIAEIYRKGLPEVAAGLIFKIAEDDADDAEIEDDEEKEVDDDDADDDDADDDTEMEAGEDFDDESDASDGEGES